MRGYIDPTEKCIGSDLYYNMFESIRTGRNMHVQSEKPTDEFKDVF